mmetsp:Transcript_48619/g.105926  ORF Transcript_48619/g.105926 Transcript_48619/m.105926 type:complete len:215 (-) Transcript_48619:112-756(-)
MQLPGMNMYPMGQMGQMPMGQMPMMNPLMNNPYQQPQMQMNPMNPMMQPQFEWRSVNNKVQMIGNRRATKTNTSTWDELVQCNMNVLNNGMTYVFEVKVHKVNSDASGMVFGFSNTAQMALDHINKEVVGLSANGKAYNYKVQQFVDAHYKVSTGNVVKVTVNTAANTIQWEVNGRVVAKGLWNAMKFPCKFGVYLYYKEDSVELLNYSGPANL